MLQHGSLLLARSDRTPEVLGVCDVADFSPGHQDWAAWLLARIPDALGLSRIDVDLIDEIRRRALELQNARYQNASWTGLR